MPKNKGKGGKIARWGKSLLAKLDLVHNEYDQEYAQVRKMFRDGRLEAVCFNDLKLLCHIPDKLQEKADVILRCYVYETEFGDESEDDSTVDIEDV